MPLPNPFSGPRMPRLIQPQGAVALTVFNDLDPMDWHECEIVLGRRFTSAELWADWRAQGSMRFLDHVALSSPATGRVPFAVLGLSATGASGVAQAVLLTRPAETWRGQIARLATGLRHAFPAHAAALGLSRVEARSWSRHPSGSALLTACGLPHECTLPGFGAGGAETFHQHAWTTADADPSYHPPQTGD